MYLPLRDRLCSKAILTRPTTTQFTKTKMSDEGGGSDANGSSDPEDTEVAPEDTPNYEGQEILGSAPSAEDSEDE